MEKELIGNRNNSIDIFRIVCAIMVVAIHTNPFVDSIPFLGYIMTQVIPRIAVPFFFLTSGYFYISKLQTGKECFWKTIINLLKIYIIWSFVYYFIDFILCIRKDNDILELIKNWIVGFFIAGSHYHFWFFPALFFAIVVTTIAYKINMIKFIAFFSMLLYIVGLLGCSYYYLGIKLPIISSIIQFSQFNSIRRVCLMGFPFFMLGFFIPQIVNKLKISAFHIICAIILFIGEIIFVCMASLQSNIVITFGLYILLAVVFCWLLQNPFKGYSNISKICHKLANFMFYVHPINIMLIQFVANLSNIMLYFLVLILSIIEGLLLIKVNNKRINIIFG